MFMKKERKKVHVHVHICIIHLHCSLLVKEHVFVSLYAQKRTCVHTYNIQQRTYVHIIIMIITIIIYPLTMRIVGAPQMISQAVSSIFPCSPLPSGTWQNPGLPIPWCCLPTSSSVCLVFFPLLQDGFGLARWLWPDLMNRRHDHTTAVCISSWWSGGLHVVWLPAGSWHGLPRW